MNTQLDTILPPPGNGKAAKGKASSTPAVLTAADAPFPLLLDEKLATIPASPLPAAGILPQTSMRKITFPQAKLQYNESQVLHAGNIPVTGQRKTASTPDVTDVLASNTQVQGAPLTQSDQAELMEKMDQGTEVNYGSSNSSGNSSGISSSDSDGNSSSNSSSDSSGNNGNTQQEADVMSSSPVAMQPQSSTSKNYSVHAQDNDASDVDATFMSMLDLQKSSLDTQNDIVAPHGLAILPQVPTDPLFPKKGTDLIGTALNKRMLDDKPIILDEEFSAIVDRAITVTDAIQFTLSPIAEATASMMHGQSAPEADDATSAFSNLLTSNTLNTGIQGKGKNQAQLQTGEQLLQASTPFQQRRQQLQEQQAGMTSSALATTTADADATNTATSATTNAAAMQLGALIASDESASQEQTLLAQSTLTQGKSAPSAIALTDLPEGMAMPEDGDIPVVTSLPPGATRTQQAAAQMQQRHTAAQQVAATAQFATEQAQEQADAAKAAEPTAFQQIAAAARENAQPMVAQVQAPTTFSGIQQAVATANPQAMEQSAAFNRVPQQVGSEGWNQAIGQRMLWLATNGQQTASLTLNPPELGPMQIVLQVHNDKADVMFFAHHLDTRQALEDAMPKLRDMMNQAGVQLGQAEVSANTSGNQQMARQESGGQREQSQGQGSKENMGADGEAIATPTSTPASPLGIVDTFA